MKTDYKLCCEKAHLATILQDKRIYICRRRNSYIAIDVYSREDPSKLIDVAICGNSREVYCFLKGILYTL